MQLIRHELYKIFSRKSLYVILMLFYALYGFIMFNQWQIANGDYKEINRVVKEWAGPIGPADIRWAEAGKRNGEKPETSGSVQALAPDPLPAGRSLTTQDSNAVLSLFHSIVFVHDEQEQHQKQIRTLEAGIAQLQKSGETGYALHAKQQELAMLQEQPPYQLYYNIGWRDAIQFNTAFGAVVVGSLILFGLAPLFSQEHTARTAGFILSSKLGRRKLVTAKLTAAFMYVASVIVFYSLVNLVYHLLMFGGYGGSDPLLSIYYLGTPYDFTLWQFFGMTALILLFGALAFGCLILLVSAWSRSPLIPLFAGIAVMAVPLLLQNMFHIRIAWVKQCIAFSYTNLIQIQSLFSVYKSYSLFGYPVLYPIVIIALHAVLAVVIVMLTYRRVRTEQISG